MRTVAHLIPLLALGVPVIGCRDADRPLAPPVQGPRFSHTPGHGLEGKIAFTSNRDGDFEIFVMNADGSNVTQRTNEPLDDYGPLWSPGGTRIAFGKCAAQCEVFVMNAVGTGVTQLTDQGGFPGAWSPDGSRIAFGRDEGGEPEVFIMNADGSGVTQLTSDEFVWNFPHDWSPDGERILFGSNRDGNAELYAMKVDGSEVIRLTDNPAADVRARWSPDGTRIVFSSDRDGDVDIFVMSADGSGVTQLTQNDVVADDYPAWSPDGTQIVFESESDGDPEIFVMNGDGSEVIQVTSNEGTHDRGPTWIQQIPPSNDRFTDAAGISGLPFGDVVDLTAASTEPEEPIPSCTGSRSKTVWYAFTPTASGSISAITVNTSGFQTVVAAYTGSSLGSLTEVGCRAGFGGRLTFRAGIGTTYYFQVDDLFDQGGLLEFRLEVAPLPFANFSVSTSDPSVFDVVQFFDQSFDPAEVGFALQQWDFGDGTTSSDCCPTHRYTADGSYTVQLTVTTFDGRTGSTSGVVQVGTHDVAITKFSAPKAASTGQTRQIVVGINSRRYLETVEVQLFKSAPGGFQFVGVLTQTVPVRPANRTTDFSFSYTFTTADAQVGKVTFKAVANIVGARDALSADNEAIAPPTKVSR